MQKIIALPLILALSGCGAGSNDDFSGDKLSNGYPDIGGKYSIRLSDIAGTCSDGSNLTVASLSTNFTVSQDGNVLEIIIEKSEPSGLVLEVVSETDYRGTVFKDGTFVVTREATYILEGIGSTYYKFTLDGEFKINTWSGDVDMNVINVKYGFSCNGKGDFKGDKL